MEYRRKKHRSRNSKNSSNTAKAVVVLIIAAAIVYILSASAAGSWIAENVFAPLFVTIDDIIRGASPSPDPVNPVVLEEGAGASASGQGVTDDVSFPAMECYALQMGVFSDRSNAQSQADELKSRGAGGYIMEDEGRYRVLAAAYSTKESLDAVREQLKAEGMDSTPYIFTSEGSTLRITAGREQLDEISAGFDALYRLYDDMSAAALEYDQSNMTPADGKERVAAILDQLTRDYDNFRQISSTDNVILSAALECFSSCHDSLNDLGSYQTQSTVDFAAKMKYTQLSIICAYDKLSKAIKAAT